MNLPSPKQWATAYATKEFISVNTCSGLRRSASDPNGEEFYFSLEVSDEELGAGVLSALSASRFLSPDEVGSFFDLAVIEKNYESWVGHLLEKFGYKSRSDVFKNMKHCTIERVDGVITIEPTNHEKLEAWGGKGIDKNDYEILDTAASDAELGKALKRCFAKCIG